MQYQKVDIQTHDYSAIDFTHINCKNKYIKIEALITGKYTKYYKSNTYISNIISVLLLTFSHFSIKKTKKARHFQLIIY